MRLLITTQAVDLDDPILGFFHGWILEFAKHFESIHVICLKEGRHELPPHVHVHSLGKESGENRLKYLWRFYSFFYKYYIYTHVDYVFFHMGAIYNVLAFPFFLLRSLRKTKFLWWKTHGKMKYLKERMALRFVDTVLTAGMHSFGFSSDKVRVVGHAIDTNYFVQREDAPHHTHACLMVGRIVPIKKIEVALEAMSLLKETVPDATLTIVGNYENDQYWKSLNTYTTDHDMHTVKFVGPCSYAKIFSQYEMSNILIHPAFEAGFDKVVLEAMASGVIPITSIPSFEPLLDPYGLYVTAKDVEGYTKTLRRIMSLSHTERTALVSALRSIVIKNHSLHTLPARIFGV